MLFGLLMEYAGFVPALFVLIVGSGAAGEDFKVGEALILAIVLTLVRWPFSSGDWVPFPLVTGS